MNFRKLVVALSSALLMTTSLALVAFSQEVSDGGQVVEKRMKAREFSGRKSRHHRRGHRSLKRMLRGVELTEDQRTQIKTLMDTNRATTAPLREEAHGLMVKRRQGTITEAEKERLTVIKDELRAGSDQLRATVLGLLTPEQSAELERRKAERKQRREERMQRWRERKERMKAETAPEKNPTP